MRKLLVLTAFLVYAVAPATGEVLVSHDLDDGTEGCVSPLDPG